MKETARRLGRLLLRMGRFTVAVGRRFLDDHCLLHASGTAYTSLLSLVPVLAIMFSVLKGLGVQQRLEPLLLNRLALDPDVTRRVIGYIDHTNVSTLGALGAVALIFTAISVLGNIEASFNHIWRVDQGRTWLRKATDYLSTLLLIPFLLLAAVAITSSLQAQTFMSSVLQQSVAETVVTHFSHLLPIVINALAIGFLYATLPNRRPHWPSIILGAAFAGCAWQLVQLTYVRMQIGVARYNAIYGALAQLPVVLVWLYVSWTVVFLGAELAAVYEYGMESVHRVRRWPLRRPVALQLLLRAIEAFRSDGRSVDAGDIARELRVPVGVVLEVAEDLAAGGVLAAVAGGPSRYVLSRDARGVDAAALDALIAPDDVPENCDARVKAFLRDLAADRTTGAQGHRLVRWFGDEESA